MGKIRDKLYIAKERTLMTLKCAVLSACLLPGIATLATGIGLGVSQDKMLKETFKEYTTSAEYAEEYNAAKEAELQRYEKIEENVKDIQQEFLNGKMTLDELEREIEALRGEIVYGKELDQRLFNNTNNPTIVDTKEKAKNMKTAAWVTGMLGAGVVFVQLAFSMYNDTLFWGPISYLIGEEIDFTINHHNKNIKDRLKREDNGEGQEQ